MTDDIYNVYYSGNPIDADPRYEKLVKDSILFTAWDNFIWTYYIDKLKRSTGLDRSVNYILYPEYGADYKIHQKYYPDNDQYIRFQTPEQRLAFILEWS